MARWILSSAVLLTTGALGGCPDAPAPDAGPVDAGHEAPPALCEEEPAGTCGAERPWLCEGGAPPSYDCETCGCPDAERCEQGICYRISLLDGQRDGQAVPTDLELNEYFTLIDVLTRGGESYGTWLDDVRARRGADPRLAALVLGEVTGEGRERALASRIAADLEASPVELGLEPTREEACSRVGEAAAALPGGGGLVSAILPAQLAHREVCAHPQHFPTCQVPFAADCALREGQLPVSLLIVDLDPLLDELERVLLDRVGGFPSGQVDFQLERSIGRFRQSVGSLPVPAGFRVTLDGAETFVRFAPGDADAVDDADFALLLDGGREPALLLGFRVLWSDSPTQAFLVDHDITAKDCEVTREEPREGPRLVYACEKGGYRVEAVVDASRYVLLEVTTTRP